MSKIKSTFIGILSSQIFMIGSMALNLLCTPFIVKNLGTELYALSILIFQISSYLSQFDFGIGSAVTKFLSERNDDNEESNLLSNKIISTSLIVYLFYSIVIVSLGYIVSDNLQRLFDIKINDLHELKKIIILVSILVGCQFLLRTVTTVFYARNKQIISNTINFSNTIVSTLGTCLFLLMGYSLWSFVYAQALALSISFIVNVYFLKKYFKDVQIRLSHFDYAITKRLFSYGFFLFLNNIAIQIIFQTDRVLVGSVISVASVAIYSLSVKLPELSSFAIFKITENAFPVLVRISMDDNKKFERAHNQIMKLALSLSIMFLWVILLISPTFITLWVGPTYFAGISFVFLASCLYLLQHTIMNVTTVSLNSAGIIKGMSLVSVAEAILNIAFSIYLGRRIGIAGVICGTIVAGCCTSFWYVPFTAIRKKGFSVVSYLIAILKPVIIVSAFGIVLYFLARNTFLQIDNWIQFLIYTTAAGFFMLIPVIIINRSHLSSFLARKRIS